MCNRTSKLLAFWWYLLIKSPPLLFISSPSILSVSADPFWVYGVFSIGASSSPSSCNSRFQFSCKHAAKTEQTIRRMIKENEVILGVPLPFCSVDVGDNPSTLLENVIPLVTQTQIDLTGMCIGDDNGDDKRSKGRRKRRESEPIKKMKRRHDERSKVYTKKKSGSNFDKQKTNGTRGNQKDESIKTENKNRLRQRRSSAKPFIQDTSKGVVVLAMLTFELTQLLSALLLPYDVPLFAVTFQAIYPSSLLEHPVFAYSYEASFGAQLHRTGINAFRKELNITVAAVLNVERRQRTSQPTKLSTRDNQSPFKRSQCNSKNVDGDTLANNYNNNNIEQLEVKNYHNRSEEERAFCVYFDMAFKKDGCLRELTVDPTDSKDVEHKVQMILQQPRLTFVVLYGSNNDIGLLRNKLDTLRKRISALDNIYLLNYEVLDLNAKHTENWSQNRSLNDTPTMKPQHNNKEQKVKALLIKDYRNVFYEVPGALAMNNLMYFTHDFERNFKHPSFMKRIMSVTKNISEIVPPELLKLVPKIQWDSLAKMTPMKQGIVYHYFKYNINIIRAQIAAWKKTFYVNLVALKLVFKHKEYSPGTALKAEPYCHLTKPVCTPGTELAHSFYRQGAWDNNYGWHCRRCAKNHYRREGYGSRQDSINNNTIKLTKTAFSKCTPCSQGCISNRARTACYDPYVKIFIRLDDASSIETLAYFVISALLMCFIVFTLLLFYSNRKTPIVRASNQQFSFLQIVTHATLTILALLVFAGEPTRLKCLARPWVVGILFTVITAINLGKTQKILLIFKAKLRMSRREIQRASASTSATVALALFADIILLIGAMFLFKSGSSADGGLKSTGKRMVTYPNQLRKEFFCSNNGDVILQLAFIFLLDMVNVIQGVRLRKVPSHYRETAYVTYSAFTCSVLLVGGSAVYATQRSEHAKTVTLWLLVLALNFVHFALIYHYKVWIMLFRPHENTRVAFDEKRKQHFQKTLEIHVRESLRRNRGNSDSISAHDRAESRQDVHLTGYQETTETAARFDTFK